MSRIWEMPQKWTFQIPSVAALLRFHGVGAGWCDPFAGKSYIAEHRNDLNPENEQPSQQEADAFLAGFLASSMNGAIFDPPYSIAQVAISYQGMGKTLAGTENPTGGFPRVWGDLTYEERQELERQIDDALKQAEKDNARLREECRVRDADRPCTI